MKDWTHDFLSRCLEGVPAGVYRDRTEAELRDHLSALCRDLEEAGYTRTEARAQTVARMGDPTELARSYLREWKRRSLWQRRLTLIGLFLFIPCIMMIGGLYIFNAGNFGKALVACWGLAAIPAAGILLCNLHGSFTGRWTAMRLCCLTLAIMQLPPIHCWIIYSGTYEFSGVMMVPGWLGLSVHVLFLAWSAVSYRMLTHFQQEDDSLPRQQNA